jgi:hypothetical protein
MNLIPGIILIIIVALIVGVFFHIWKGGGLFRLILFLTFSLIGFLIGQWIGSALQSTFLLVGWVQLGMGLIFSIVVCVIGIWLSNIKIDKKVEK